MRNICVKLFRTWASVQKGLFKTFFLYIWCPFSSMEWNVYCATFVEGVH